MLANNGNQLAEIMHKQGILKNNMSLDECASEAKKDIAVTEQHHRWLNNDDFWEDFAYRADELGYKLKY
jgi:hypothetical protein